MENQTKTIIITIAILAAIALFLVTNNSKPKDSLMSDKVSDGNLISSNGLHWHPKLEIMIDSKLQEIPIGIGLEGSHNPMHTHESDGTIHLEYSGSVLSSDITLGRFFEVWGKELSTNSVLDFSTKNGDSINFSVNGKQINDPVNHQFEDGQTVLIEVITNKNEV